MTTLADFRRWSLRRKLRNPLAGIRIWQPTNVDGARVIIARHWPHLLCWSWSLWGYGPRSRANYRKFGLHWYTAPRGQIHVSLGLGVIGFNFQTQDYDYMGRGPDAPRVDWDAERARGK